MVIENLPNVNIQLGGDIDGTSNAPIHISDFEDASEVAVMCNYKYQDFVSKNLPVVMKPFAKEQDETVEIIEVPDEKKPKEEKKSFHYRLYQDFLKL